MLVPLQRLLPEPPSVRASGAPRSDVPPAAVARGRLDPSLTPAIERLRPLVSAASELDLDDGDGWARLRRASRAVIGVLVAKGQLPSRFTISPGDSPMRVEGTLAAAWQYATSAWPQRHHRY